MTFVARKLPGTVQVLDTAMMRRHYLSAGAWQAFLEKNKSEDQDALYAASEYITNHRGELIKQPSTHDALLLDYLSLRSGGVVRYAIPKTVTDALSSLNAAVAAVKP